MIFYKFNQRMLEYHPLMTKTDLLYVQDHSKIKHQNSYPHSLQGPAIEGSGYKEWWTFGRPHRLDGPAFELGRDGIEKLGHFGGHYLHGMEIFSETEFDLIVASNDPVKIAIKTLKIMAMSRLMAIVKNHITLSLKKHGLSILEIKSIFNHLDLAQGLL